MYDIYIKNYANSSGVVQTTEALLYSIPLTPTYQNNILTDPVVKTEMGKAGTLEFSVHPDHPYYNCWQQMKTIMRIVYDGTTIFRGRTLTIDNTLFGDKKIHCESDFAFFMDSFQVGTKEEKRTEITILAYLQQIINAHNTQMAEASESDKYFTLGEVPGQYTNATATEQRVKTDATKKYGSDSWETSMSALEALQKQYGGYFRTRYDNGTTYLDWLDNYFDKTAKTQRIEIGENLIDLQNSAEVDNIFTALIPIGSKQSEEVLIDGHRTDIHGSNNNRILVPQIVSMFTDAQLNSGYHAKSDYQNAVNKYGIIYKTQKFENADTQEKLFEYACDYILRNYIGGITSFTLTAVDMHHINGTVAKYLVGDRIPIRYPDLDSRANGTTPTIDKTLTATSIAYNLHNPEKNTYSIGIPNSLVEKKYGSSNGKGGGGGGGAGGNNDIEEEDFKKAYDHDKSENGILAWRYIIDEKYNNAEYQELLAQDPNLQWAPKALKTGKTIIKGVLDDTTLGKTIYNSIVVGGGKIEMKPNLDLVHVTNPDLMNVFNTANSLVFDAHEGHIELREKYVQGKIIDATHNLGTVMSMEANPTYGKLMSWLPDHPKESTNPVLAAMLDGSDGTIASIINKLGLDGSGEKATIFQDGLTSMLKFFNPSTATSANPTETVELDGTNGKGKVGKDNNSNWQVELNNTVTYTDENNQQQTASGFVSAKDFNIPSVASFKTKLLVVDDLIAARATIGQLNALAARVGTLEADAITTTNLSSSLSNLSSIVANAIQCNGSLAAGSLIVGSRSASWQNTVVVTAVGVTLPTVSVGNQATFITTGGNVTGQLVTGRTQGSVSPTTKTIYFLGDIV